MRTETRPVELLDRVLAPIGRCLTHAAAKEIISLKADKKSRARVKRLAEKCEAGALTPDERAEYRLYVEVGDLVAVLQAKARRYLVEHSAL